MKEGEKFKMEAITADKVKMEEVENTDGIFIQWLLSEKEGSERIYIRRFTLKPGAKMPFHKHGNCEHLQYYLKGKGKVRMGKKDIDVNQGDALFIPSGVPHSYLNTGDDDLQFLCIVPGIDIETDFL